MGGKVNGAAKAKHIPAKPKANAGVAAAQEAAAIDWTAAPTYIGCKVIAALEVTGDKPGYAVRYADGYVSWSPKAAFEDAYVPVPPEQASERLDAAMFAIKSDPGQASAAELAAIARAERAEDQVRKLEEQLKQSFEDLAAAQAELKKVKGEKQRAVKALPKSPKARKLGAMARDADLLAAAMSAGEPMELVFSTGTHEIVELEPLEVHADGFHKGVDYSLIDAPLVKADVTGIRVRGVALVAAGVQVAWCGFPEPVALPPGQEVKFDKMIAF